VFVQKARVDFSALVADRTQELRMVFHLLSERRENNLLYTIVAIFLILWLLGFTLHIAGSLIHLLLVIAVVIFLANLVMGRRNN
jgi:hypothetical protein